MRITRTITVGTVATLLAASSAVFTAGTAHAAEPVALVDAITALPVAEETRAGYDRDLFNHWIDADKDGCDTRREVLIAEATMAPGITGKCTVADGQWYSYYDDVYVTGSRSLDIDHLVPLAEAWDSGAAAWTPERREAYANDLGESIPLIAVTGKSNRSKADKDPTDWLPPSSAAHCRYVYEWVSVKTRWALSVDTAEQQTLAGLAADCPTAIITITSA